MGLKTIRWSALAVLITFLLGGSVMLGEASSLSQTASNGEAIFKSKCFACHTIGGGKRIGPDLKGVTQLRDLAWLAAWIKAPDKVLAGGDPLAVKLMAENNNIPMPNLQLSDSDVADVVAYLQSMDAASAAAPAAPNPAAAPTPQPLTPLQSVLMLNGDAASGEKLFTGAEPLLNGGTHCMACHTVGGIGALGGGTLGPDLTHVYKKYGREGLAAALGTVPFPTMQGIFAKRPLDETEQADLLAFFEQANQGSSSNPGQNLAVVAAGGGVLTLLLLAGMAYFWPRQRMSISQRLRKYGKL